MKKIILISALFTQFVLSGLFSQALTGDIELYIGSYINNLPGSSGNDYSIPETSDLDTWQELMTHLLNDNLSLARQKADLVNYQIIEFEDNSVSPHAFYYVLEEKGNRLHYWGTFIINRYPLRSQLVIQSPNPDYIPILKNELYKVDNSLSFKIAHIDLDWSRLIAFTNVQGRFINNSI